MNELPGILVAVLFAIAWLDAYAMPSMDAERIVRPTVDGGVFRSDAYGGRERVDTYAGSVPYATGKEYLWAVYNKLESGNNPVQVNVYGDSTAEGGMEFLSWEMFVRVYFAEAVSAKGINNRFDVVNKAVGGSNLSTWAPVADFSGAGHPDLVVLKTGINDSTFPPEVRFEKFKGNLERGLSAIRSMPYGGVDETAILIVGPNVTIDKAEYMRNAEWYEQLRPVFEALCAKYRCAYFDTYAYLRDAGGEDDSLWAMGRWLDNARGANKVALHPRNVGQAWIWGAIVDWMFGDSETLRWSGNRIRSRSAAYGFPHADMKSYPVNYPSGLTLESARKGDGYPFDGMLMTVRMPDGALRQVLSCVDDDPRTATRTSSAEGNWWGGWSGVDVPLDLGAGWRNFGEPYAPASVSVDDAGNVYFSGVIRQGVTTEGITVFSVPKAMKPETARLIAIDGCEFVVWPDGQVKLGSRCAGRARLSLSGASYRK